MSVENRITIVIIAAGKGKRVANDLKKAFLPVGNFILLEHSLLKAKLLMPDQIILVVAEDMKAEIPISIEQEADIVIQDKQLGTAHAVYSAKHAQKYKEGITIIMLVDTPLIPLETLQQGYEIVKNQNDILLVSFSSDNPQYGRLKVIDGKIVEIIEQKENKSKNYTMLCNSGIFLVKTDILWKLLPEISNDNSSEEYYLTDIVKIANQHNITTNSIVISEDYAMGVNTLEDLVIIENIFQNNKRAQFLKNGVVLIDPASVYFSLDTIIESNVIVHPNVIFLPNTIIKSSSTILPFSVIEGSCIESFAKIGPFTHLRHGSVIHEHSKIGSFVEIKHSVISSNTKVPHLAYLGDALVGENTNIGANFTICNFDGEKKHSSFIGDNCFIGSNSTIISPVKIGNNATIAAGSVITNSVEEEHLAISRVPQLNKPYINKINKKLD